MIFPVQTATPEHRLPSGRTIIRAREQRQSAKLGVGNDSACNTFVVSDWVTAFGVYDRDKLQRFDGSLDELCSIPRLDLANEHAGGASKRQRS
jgi:hypothetical protein